MIRRLAYVSRSRSDLPRAEIPRIVATSRANNEREDISGVLVYTGTDFAQLIEGDPPRVEALWRRIRADPRHIEITMLMDEHDASRWFPDWRMGYLAHRDHAVKLSEWRALDHPFSNGERQDLLQLFAAADSL